MRKFIGYGIAKIGAYLWENGGFWTCDDCYENLKVTGKLGYHLACSGLKMMGISLDKIDTMKNL